MSDKQNNNDSIAFTAPHWAATQAGLNVLKEGGTATEAMVAAAAMITVVYPHMNAIGGDSFWLIDKPTQEKPLAIDACGRSAAVIPDDFMAQNQLAARGGLSAITQGATLRGWQMALQEDDEAKLPLSRLLAPAIEVAEKGFKVSESLAMAAAKLSDVPERNQAFKDLYDPQGRALQVGDHFSNPLLANTFRRIANAGIDDFFEGEIAGKIIATLNQEGSLLTAADIAATRADIVEPLSIRIDGTELFNLPAPTQGVSSLMILGIADQLKHRVTTEADLAHLLVEATKCSFSWRNQMLTDLDFVDPMYHRALNKEVLGNEAQQIDMQQAAPWPQVAKPGDTVWMGARDKNGQMVSFIQSIYWEFGSGIAIEGGGFVWNNRGLSFSMDKSHVNCLAPKKKPFHTLNPAVARYNDGRRMVYGTMGGEGQPQTQAALFARYSWRNVPLSEAVSRGRWLLGRTWGDDSNNLKVEADIAAEIGDELTLRGHEWIG